MTLRRALLSLLGLWVGLGVVLAPARPMPGMAMGSAPAPAQQVSATQDSMTGQVGMSGYGEHRNARPDNAGLHEGAPSTTAAPDPSPAQQEPAGHDHLARCVLCVVGAGTLGLITVVVWASSPARVNVPVVNRLEQPRRFRLFRSRAPPAVYPNRVVSS